MFWSSGTWRYLQGEWIGTLSQNKCLARIMHKLSTAVPQSSTLTARPASGCLRTPYHRGPCGTSSRKPMHNPGLALFGALYDYIQWKFCRYLDSLTVMNVTKNAKILNRIRACRRLAWGERHPGWIAIGVILFMSFPHWTEWTWCRAKEKVPMGCLF